MPGDAQNRVVLGNGDGSYNAGTAIGSETDTTADIDRDGNVDLIVANSGQTNKLYFGDGAGGFSATGIDIGSETASTISIAIGDLDRDGDVDLVANDGTVKRVYLGNGGGGFSATGTVIGADSASTSAIALGDFTSDGALDLVVINSGATSKIHPGDDSGGFTGPGFAIPLASGSNA